jgi:periplasmic protein CpxP/Spy
MTMRVPKLPHLAALLLAAVPLPVMAQPVGQLPAQSNPGATQLIAPAATPAPALAQTESQMQTATEQRISGLQAQLAITPAQMPQWNAFAQVMRENAQTTDALFRQRAAGVQSMNAADNMQSYAQLSRAYGDGSEKLAAAFQASYAMLSDQQKQAADTLFRQQAAQSAQIPVVKLR